MPQDLRERAPQGVQSRTKGFGLLKPQAKPLRGPSNDEKHLRPIGLVGRQPALDHGEDDDESDVEEEDDEEETAPVDSDKQRLREITQKHREICEQYGKDKVHGSSLIDYMGGQEAFNKFLDKYGDVLWVAGEKQETLLHRFVRQKKGVHMIKYLIKQYPDLVQCEDQDGNSAPHIAIDKKRETFIRVILKSDQGIPALRQNCGNKNLLHKVLQSMLPAMEHIHRALSHVSDAQQGQEIFHDLFTCKDKKGQTPLHVAIHTIARSNSGVNTKFLPQVTSLITEAVAKVPQALNETDDTGQTPLHLALKAIGDADYTKSPQNIKDLIQWVRTLTTLCPDAFYKCTKDDKLPYALLGAAKNDTVVSGVAEDIKRLYMRHFSVEKLKEILYGARGPTTEPRGAGPGLEKTIFFDLSNDVEKNLDYSHLTKLARHVQFESILHHVELPSMTVSGGEELLTSLQDEHVDSESAPSLPGRVDFVKIFQWLRNRGVREIIDASVVDSHDSPHCEEAIEVALRGFAVEILNWDRFDLSSGTIFNAAPGVRELYLYSSGNNEVLRGWSAPGGLDRLTKLQKVHLSVQRGVASEARIREYINQFQQRLHEVRPNIEIVEERMANRSSPQISLYSETSANSSKHPWLDTVDQFANVVKTYHRHMRDHAPTIKTYLQNNVDGGTSFHYRPGRNDRPIDYWSATGGHGTEMAKLICRICPMARLYAVRLGEGHGEKGVRQIRVDTAIKAIKWATSAGVNIISMSWSINRSNISPQQYDEFQKCVRAAYDKNITMFCAASDHGNSSASIGNDDLPAAFTDPLKIGAATVDGGKWSKTGAQKLDFYLPGENLPLMPPRQTFGQFPQQALSGSSLATAVAAGLAALLQYCMGTAAKNLEDKPVFRPDDMKHAFQELNKKDPDIPEVHVYFGNADELDTPQKTLERYEWIATCLHKSLRV